MKKKTIKALEEYRDLIINHYKEFTVVEGINLYKSKDLDKMITKEQKRVEELNELIRWIKEDRPSFLQSFFQKWD